MQLRPSKPGKLQPHYSWRNRAMGNFIGFEYDLDHSIGLSAVTECINKGCPFPVSSFPLKAARF